MVPPAMRALLSAALTLWPALSLGGIDTTLQVFDQEAYDTRVLPAFGSFVRMHDARPLKALVRETIRRLRAQPTPRALRGHEDPAGELEIALEILDGSTARDDHLSLIRGGKPVPRTQAVNDFVAFSVFPLLLDAICIVRVDGSPLELDLWNSRLARHLYSRSAWIKDAFHGMQPPWDVPFEFSRCEGTGAVPPWFVDVFLRELRRVPRPASDTELQREYDLLLRMLEMVRASPALRLAVEAC